MSQFTAICSTRVSFGDALNEPDLLSRIECLNTEGAARTALAFEAVAHGDADGIASNCYLELSATACGFAVRHVDYLSDARREIGEAAAAGGDGVELGEFLVAAVIAALAMSLRAPSSSLRASAKSRASSGASGKAGGGGLGSMRPLSGAKASRRASASRGDVAAGDGEPRRQIVECRRVAPEVDVCGRLHPATLIGSAMARHERTSPKRSSGVGL
jgi:hypothetical protein